jgi:glutathione S-transferase
MRVSSQSPEHMARHPWGKVPAITTSDGFTLYESHAIAKYLTAKHGFALLPPPSNLEAVALFDQAESCQLCYFNGPAGTTYFEKFFKRVMNSPIDEAAVLAAREKLGEFFAVVDGILAKQEYMAGNKYSLADVFYVPLVARLFVCSEGDLVSKRNNVCAWWERCLARPTVKEFVEGTPTIEQVEERIRARREAKQ